jgi:hypothetical protein
MATLRLKTLTRIVTEDASCADNAPLKINSSVKRPHLKITVLLAMTLVFLAAVTADTQKREKSEAEIAYEKSMTELDGTLSKLTAIAESNKKLAKSNQAQIDGLALLAKQERKILNVDGPALKEKIIEFNKMRARVIASGCPEEPTMVSQAEAVRCDALADQINEQHVSLQQAKKDQAGDLASIADMRVLSYNTTLENAKQQKQNNADSNDLEARKLVLFSEVITRAMKIVKNQAAARQACASRTLSLEESSCCLSVVDDGKNPKDCAMGVTGLYNLFKNGGVFSNNR